MQRRAIDLAKSVYPVAESVKVDQMRQRKRLSQAAWGNIYRSRVSRRVADGDIWHNPRLGSSGAVTRSSHE